MRCALAAVLWILPSLLLANHHTDSVNAEAQARAVLRSLSPTRNAAFAFRRTERRLAHLARPWQTWDRQIRGEFVAGPAGAAYYQVDSLAGKTNLYLAYTYYSDTMLARIDFGESEPGAATAEELARFPYDLAVMTPMYVLRAFLAHGHGQAFIRSTHGSADTVAYRTADGMEVRLAFDRATPELRSVSTISASDLYGDVVSTITYANYAAGDGGHFRYPTTITEHVLGFDANVVTIAQCNRAIDTARIAAMVPPSYHLTPPVPKPTATITRTDYRANLHLLHLAHANAQALVVEFRDFLVVAEAPLSPANGEMIVAEARAIAPGKPIAFFVFGHFHPHYIGGLRAFVHNGSTVIATAPDTAYLRQLVSFPHTLAPDSLELAPRPLKVAVVDSQMVIADSSMEMRIIHIGTMSHHTDDYLIYYFPRYKLLFQDDLASIANKRPLTAAGERQKGLYDAIVKHGLDVETIVQSWPASNASQKMVFSFDELRQSVAMTAPTR